MKTALKYAGNTAKVIFFITLMIICMAAFIASINETMAATPNQNVTVTGENITLGDVFDGVKAKDADFVLAPAPQPHKTLTWDARTLNRIAKAFSLNWRASGSDQIQIRRLANIVTEDMITKAVLADLKSEGLKNHMDLDFVGGNTDIILPHDIEPQITVISSSYNASRQTFSAALRLPDETVKNVSGVTYPLVTVPVLKTAVRRGDMITRNMVTSKKIRDDILTEDMALSASDLIGMTPRKIIRAGLPVEMRELAKPTIVERGDLITMQLNSGQINITAIAKAMESGTKGDIIRLMNMDSKRTLEARVTGIREATVLN
jgi:flagella basal body P-ring formation protein FlgA